MTKDRTCGATRGTAGSRDSGISSKDDGIITVNEFGEAINTPASTNELRDAINTLDINSGPGISKVPSSE